MNTGHGSWQHLAMAHSIQLFLIKSIVDDAALTHQLPTWQERDFSMKNFSMKGFLNEGFLNEGFLNEGFLSKKRFFNEGLHQIPEQ